MSDAGSKRSGKTSIKGSTTASSSAGIISKESTTIDGTVFMKIRACPLSGKKNTDLNPVATGKYGPTFSKHVIWHRGQSTMPEGRYDRISILTWQHGGFADQWPDVEKFEAELVSDRQVQAEFKAAYAGMVKVIEEGRLRFKGSEKDKLKMSLDQIRKEALKEYNKAEMHIKVPHRGIDRDVYEAKHPGRIEAKGLKVVKLPCEGGQMKEVVLLPKLPKGHYDIDGVDILGSMRERIVDDGESTVGAGQLDRKFKALAGQAQSAMAGAQDNRQLEEQAEVEEAEAVRNGSDVSGSEQSGDSDAGSSASDLHFVRSSLFNDVDVASASSRNRPPPSAPSVASGCFRPKSKAASKAASSPGKPISKIDKPQSPGKTISKIDKFAAAGTVPGTAAEDKSDANVSNKFTGKLPEEILEKHGLPDLLEELEAVKNKFADDTFSKLAPPPSYNDDLEALRKDAVAVHKKAVALDIKAKKWKGLPQSLVDYLAQLRAEPAAASEAPRLFVQGCPKGARPDKMLTAFDDFRALSWAIPLAFKGIYFHGQNLDYLRFGNIGEKITAMDVKHGYLKDVGDKSEVEHVIMESVSVILKNLTAPLTMPGEDSDTLDLIHNIRDLAAGLADLNQIPAWQADLSDLATSLGYGSPSPAKRSAAIAALQKTYDKLSHYRGVLKMMMGEPTWSILFTWASSQKPAESSGVSFAELKHAFATWNVDAPDMNDKAELEMALARTLGGLSTLGGNAKEESSAKAILCAILEKLKLLPNEVEAMIVRVCEKFKEFVQQKD